MYLEYIGDMMGLHRQIYNKFNGITHLNEYPLSLK